MVEVENRNWQTIEHSPFAMPYAGQIVLHSFSGEELSEEEQVRAAAYLSEEGEGLRTIVLDSDEFLPRFTLTLRMEAEGDKDALQRLCGAAINGWAAVGNDVEDLELVEVHLVYEPELEADHENDPSTDISDAHYRVEDLELSEIDEFDAPIRLEVREVFYRTRDEVSS
jgi:hypothetical protein